MIKISKEMRRLIVSAAYHANHGHIPSALSIVEIMKSVIGDGEINEGSIWESILIAVDNKLDNLICVVDYNKSQIRSLEPKLNIQMFESFGCDVIEIDGHDVDSLVQAMKLSSVKKPKVILANTVKGKGIKEIEDNMFAWHHRAPTEEEYKRFCEEIYES